MVYISHPTIPAATNLNYHRLCRTGSPRVVSGNARQRVYIHIKIPYIVCYIGFASLFLCSIRTGNNIIYSHIANSRSHIRRNIFWHNHLTVSTFGISMASAQKLYWLRTPIHQLEQSFYIVEIFAPKRKKRARKKKTIPQGSFSLCVHVLVCVRAWFDCQRLLHSSAKKNLKAGEKELNEISPPPLTRLGVVNLRYGVIACCFLPPGEGNHYKPFF